MQATFSDADHRSRLTQAAGSFGRLDLLVNNASDLGLSPLPRLSEYPLGTVEDVFRVNLIAPLGLVQSTLPLLTESGGVIINISSDAAVGGYPGWGAYGASKAALVNAGLDLTHYRRFSIDPPPSGSVEWLLSSDDGLSSL